MKHIIIVLLSFFASEIAFAQRIKTILGEQSEKSVQFSIAPLMSQMRLESSGAAGYTSWGFVISGVYQTQFLELFDTRSGVAFQRSSGGNNLNNASNREDSVSSGIDVFTGLVVFDRIFLGGGIQRRSLSLSIVSNSALTEMSYSGWVPFGQIGYDIIASSVDSPLGIVSRVAYYSGLIESARVVDLQFSVAVSYFFDVK